MVSPGAVPPSDATDCDCVAASTVITLRGYQLDIATQLSTGLKNRNVGGLLGNYNDIASDDLVSRTGRTVDAGSSEETIHYEFGETCKLLLISGDREHRSRIRYLSKNNSRILTNFPKLKKFVKIRTKIR